VANKLEVPRVSAQVEALRDALRARGLRATPQRVAVLAALRQLPQPATHREIAEGLPELDKVTVFRGLVGLVEAGLARRVEAGDRVYRYEAHDDAHDPHGSAGHAHFTCTSCGDVQCLDGVQVVVNAGDAALASVLGEAEVQLRGVCGACR
jgi:Fur family ferric uptake transcriptional regulator